MLAFLARQGDEPGDLLRDRQQRLQRPVIGNPLQLQRQTESGVRDERERMRRVDGQWRQHRKDIRQEMAFQKFQVPRRQARPLHDADPFAFHFLAQPVERRLLGLHQPPCIGVDQGKLFGGTAAIFRHGCIAVADQRPQARDPHRIEFVQVGRRDGQEPQPFQKRHRRICSLLQHTPVERQPRKLAVEEPARPGGFRKGQRDGGREGGFKEIGLGHRWVMPHAL